MHSETSFDEALAAARGVDGWMTDAQARRLWERARAVAPRDRIVEIGSFHGRSAIVLAKAAPPDAEVIAIDPHAGNDRGPQEIHGSAAEGERDHQIFLRNLERAGVDRRVSHIRLPAHAALHALDGEAALVYVDGAHRYRPARGDIEHWGARVRPGGTLLIHDAFSSIGVTLAIARLLMPARCFRYVGRVGSLAEYRHEPLTRAARARNAFRQAAELPWFARNVLVKLALVTGLRPLARVLGHEGSGWPY